jgi:lipoprotein-releasing system permease protein
MAVKVKRRKGCSMFSGYEVFIAKRYLMTRKKTGFISIISLISISGITLGVAALIIVLSLMNGFAKELRSRLVGMDGHVWVSTPMEAGMSNYQDIMERLGSIKGVIGVSPFCGYSTVAHDRTRKHIAQVRVRGVDTVTISSVSEIQKYITEGSLDLMVDKGGTPGIVIGRYVSSDLGNVGLGDIIFLYGVSNVEVMFDNLVPPPLYKFRVTGIFDSGYYEYDNSVVLIDIVKCQSILGLENRASGIVLKLTNAFDAKQYTKEGGYIDKTLGGYPYFSEDWIEKNKILFRWMTLEKWTAFIILSLIILVAAFNIVSSLIMMVMDKTREVGILKSMGATNKSIKRIFVYQGVFVGVTGTIFGSIIGYTLCFIQDKYHILSLPPDIYFISAVPMDLQMRDFIAITVIALFLCWFSSFYPAQKAAELDPVEAIRYE